MCQIINNGFSPDDELLPGDNFYLLYGFFFIMYFYNKCIILFFKKSLSFIMMKKYHVKNLSGSQLLIISSPHPNMQGFCNILPISPVLPPSLSTLHSMLQQTELLMLPNIFGALFLLIPLSTCHFSVLQTDFNFFRGYFSSWASCKKKLEIQKYK